MLSLDQRTTIFCFSTGILRIVATFLELAKREKEQNCRHDLSVVLKQHSFALYCQCFIQAIAFPFSLYINILIVNAFDSQLNFC